MTAPSSNLCIALGVVFPFVATLLVGQRFYGHHKKSRTGYDDWLALIALVAFIALGTILVVGAIHYGFGKVADSMVESGYNNDLSHITVTTKHLHFSGPLVHSTGLSAAKLLILIFYRRIFRGKAFNIASWTLIALSVSWWISNFFLSLLQCAPHISSSWSSEKVIAGACLPGSPLGLYNAPFDFALDVLILILPIYWASKIRMHRGKKMLVYFVFLFGAIAVFSSLARLVVFTDAYRTHNISSNELAFLTNTFYAEMLELGFAIVAVCLPTIGNLISDERKGRIAKAIDWKLSSLQRRSTRRPSYGDSKSTVFRRPSVPTKGSSGVDLRPLGANVRHFDEIG